jgi:type IV pilus assembly protein PilC
MVVMSRQLATLVRAGVPIVESLATVALQTENPILADAMREVRLQVVGGIGLAQAMRQHPKVFSDLYCSLVEAGEVGGVLDQTLDIAATQFDKEAVLKAQIKSAMTYPILVMVAAFGVVLFMLLVIVPVFKKVYTQFHANLPSLTQLLVAISDIFVHWWWLAILLIVAIVVGWSTYRKSPGGRLVTDQLFLKLPLVGKVIRKIAISRFTQTFGSATQGGIPILRALAVSANTSGNHVIRNAVMEVATHVQEGAQLAPPLDATGEFPPMVIRMIAAGEKSGSLSLMLDEITKFYERDVDYAVQKLTRLLEPLMTVVVGAIVLFVMLSLYMPIFNLGNVIKR